MVLVLLLGVFVSCGGSAGEFLGPVGVTTHAGGHGKVGEILNVGFQFSPNKTSSVNLLSARLFGAPKNLETVGGLIAVHAAQVGGDVGALWGDQFSEWRKKGLIHQVGEVVFQPGHVSDWDIVAAVKSDVPGDYETSGISLTYRVGSSTYTQSFPFKIRLTVTR